MTVSADALREGCSYYDVLGVPRDADYLTIRRSFLAAALAHHPDRITNRSQSYSFLPYASELSSGLRHDGCLPSNPSGKSCSAHDLTEPFSVDDRCTIRCVSRIVTGDANCNNGKNAAAIDAENKGRESGAEFLCTSTDEGDGCSRRSLSAAETVNEILEDAFVVEPEEESVPAEVGRDDNNAASFRRIHDAWSVLRDLRKRKEYDEELNAAATRWGNQLGALVEDVDLDDMSWEQSDESCSTGQYVYPCRCGDCYVVKDEDLMMTCTKGAFALGKHSHVQSLITHCGSCSLSIRIQFCMVDRQQ
ncbi:hypothetical protein CBR_g3068 [Chara braunii]|uniref:J domain-containing protein n=1 Tax=Chara braunii TaxID=69332 RepID=A0A388KEP2_CHABU|nr:hypothetical protein CBR_g3068 [Chara braunii]|eukprot:GBG68524.1 hypothetical protein CBR_g3068 [Chara braunii]